jgi:glycosyltransferase involved in cell wall biosynthesis
MTLKDDGNTLVFFTIVIPTRDRCDTLLHTLSTALAQNYKNFAVLVSDNASTDGTREKVLNIEDSRLRYINTGERLSMSENWEFALNHVDAGWVTILGDDDAILPGSLDRVNQIINETGVKAIRSNGCSYSWPGLNFSDFGSLGISLKKGYEKRHSNKMLQQVIDGRRHYNELPMLYNGGFVSIDLVKKSKKIAGKFFHSMTPDVYSAVVFSLLTENYIYSHEPLAINGASLHSGGTAGFESVKRKRDYDPTAKFWSENNMPFHKDIPLVPTKRPVRSISVTVYEAFLQAIAIYPHAKITTSHTKQLHIALEKGGPDQCEIDEWAKLFAEQHGLYLPSPLKVKINKIILKFKSLPSRISKFLYNYPVIGSNFLPISNVYDASIIAGFTKSIPPSISRGLIYRIKALFQRAKKWLF